MKKLNSLLLDPKNRELLWDNLAELSAIYENSTGTTETLKDTKVGDFVSALSPKAQSMMKMLVYLGFVESLGVTLIDMVLFLLIANGKEMHISRGGGIKHVSTLKELKTLKLAYKLDFLKRHELDFFGKPINRYLRNQIAHLSFSIEEDGTIRASSGHEVNIDDSIASFWSSVSEITLIFGGSLFTKFLEQAAREKEQAAIAKEKAK
jgi:hypothetical protein